VEKTGHLAKIIARGRAQAEKLPPGPSRDRVMAKLRQAEESLRLKYSPVALGLSGLAKKMR